MLKILIFDEKTGVPDTDNSNRMLNALVTYAFQVGYEDTPHPKMSRKAKKGYKRTKALVFANGFITNLVATAQEIIKTAESRGN